MLVHISGQLEQAPELIPQRIFSSHRVVAVDFLQLFGRRYKSTIKQLIILPGDDDDNDCDYIVVLFGDPTKSGSPCASPPYSVSYVWLVCRTANALLAHLLE